MLSRQDTDRFMANPAEYFGYSLTKMMSVPQEQLQALHLAGVQRRFEQLRDRVPILQRLANSVGVERIDTLEDVLPMLFDHATYKSYPAVLLDKGRYKQLTAWLDKLTVHDLSGVDVSGCRNLDDWMITLNRETPMAVCHTSGTSGTMSFLPWSKTEWLNMFRQYPTLVFQTFGRETATPLMPPLNIPCIYPYYRSGGMSHTLANDAIVQLIAGSEERFHCAYPQRLSADMLLLAARLRAASLKGQELQLDISPELMARRAEFEAQQRDMPQHLARFFEHMRNTLAGQRVFLLATSNLLYSMAEDGLKRGLSNVFSRDSVVVTGGGGKGIVLPPDWRDRVKTFLGVDQLHDSYGMSELAGPFMACEHGHYHAVPWIVPFVLDPQTNKPLPRSGAQTGRMAFYDLLPDTRWGGFITGDEVTLHCDGTCACGRTTPYLSSGIQRLSDKQKQIGGEEKISCAETASAYEDALDFLNDIKG